MTVKILSMMIPVTSVQPEERRNMSATPTPTPEQPAQPSGPLFGNYDPNQIMVQKVLDSCTSRAIMSYGMGGALGFFLGGIFTTYSNVDAQLAGNETTKMKVRQMLRETWVSSKSMARNFAFVGFVYSGTECAIEKFRAKHDIYNSVSAGCLTGAALAVRAGPGAMCAGCAAFSAFSYAIDKLTNAH